MTNISTRSSNDRMLELPGLIQAYSRTNASQRPQGFGRSSITCVGTDARSCRRARASYCQRRRERARHCRPYDTAVLKFAVNVEAMRDTLPIRRHGRSFVSDDVARDALPQKRSAVRKTAALLDSITSSQLGRGAFHHRREGLAELRRCVKNLRPKTEEPEDEIIRPLPDARKSSAHAGYGELHPEPRREKTRVVNGIRVIDSESCVLILEKNQGARKPSATSSRLIPSMNLWATSRMATSCGNDTEGAFSTMKQHRYTAAVQAFASRLGRAAKPLESAIKLYDRRPAPGTIPASTTSAHTLDYESANGKAQAARRSDAYFADLAVRGSAAGSGRNPKNIDLIIVATRC
jgi:hypothetical protein